MNISLIESLESRRLLSSTAIPDAAGVTSDSESLSTVQVQLILAQAISQARPGQAAVVVDREGTVLGTLAGKNVGTGEAGQEILFDATARARTAAAFESDGEAFSSRTARFIIQNNFPPGVENTPGGPLYGVEFSSLGNSDILLNSQSPAISGDPGGIPLYIDGIAVGAIGVAGDGHDIAATQGLLPNPKDPPPAYNPDPKGKYFKGTEEPDFDEAVAQAGAKGFMPPPAIRANNVFINGLALPFTAEPPAHKLAFQPFQTLINSGAAVQNGTIIPGEPEVVDTDANTINTFGSAGTLRDRSKYVIDPATHLPTTTLQTNPQNADDVVDALDGISDGLTITDVDTIIKQAVETALKTRAGIRRQTGGGTPADIQIAVVDTEGNVLGAFRMADATNFSYDVAVQKARTANFFSDDTHAFSTRAIGFMSQKFFPLASDDDRLPGPLFNLQNKLDQVNMSDGQTTSYLLDGLQTPIPRAGDSAASLADGITIFPGGIPLYKDGHIVGAIGVSGDGVDQDDFMSYGGTAGFRPPTSIRSDELPPSSIVSFIQSHANDITTALGLSSTYHPNIASLATGVAKVRLPYVKFPRRPLVTD
jgi:uncharacterized protein GlcG (DUF336 family)